MVRVVRATQVEIETAVQALRDGELVAFPTETVYGLGANAQNPAAVRRIFEAKERPPNHPVIVHLDSPRYLHRWVREVPDSAARLADAFWPGPLTLVMRRAANVHDVITGGQDTIAIRVPAHPMAQQLLTAFGGGIAAPSANRFGRLSPTRAEHVREEFGESVRVILDGGECQIGLESTIVAFEDGSVRLLRPGSVTAAQIRSVVGELLVGPVSASPSRITRTLSPNSSRTCSARVGESRPYRLAEGAAMPPPKAVSSCWAIGCAGTRIAMVSWPPVITSCTLAARGITMVSGPGQKASASRPALSGTSRTQRCR